MEETLYIDHELDELETILKEVETDFLKGHHIEHELVEINTLLSKFIENLDAWYTYSTRNRTLSHTNYLLFQQRYARIHTIIQCVNRLNASPRNNNNNKPTALFSDADYQETNTLLQKIQEEFTTHHAYSTIAHLINTFSKNLESWHTSTQQMYTARQAHIQNWMQILAKITPSEPNTETLF
jgi:hypothetical protein